MNVVGRVERRKLAVKAKKKWEFDHRTVSKGERRKAAKEAKRGSEEVNLVMDGSESNYLTALPLTGADQHPVEGGGGDKAGVGECADAGEVIGTVADQHSVEGDGGGDEAEGGKFSDAGEVIGTVADQHPGEGGGGGGDEAGGGECADADEVIGTVADQHPVECDGGGNDDEAGGGV